MQSYTTRAASDTRAALAAIREADEGRRRVVDQLLALCLRNRALCRLLDRYRCGIVQDVPPLNEIHGVLNRSVR